MRWSASGGESDDDASSRISRSISTLAPSRRGSVAPNVQKLECNLGSVFFNYNKLHIVVCRRKIKELDKAVKDYVASLDEGIQLVASSAGSAVHTSAYDTASKALGFSRQLMSSYFDTIEAQCAEEAQRDQALCMGYQLMEMTMSRFRTVLQTVELEKELADNATVVSEMDISVVATDGHDDDSTSGTPPQAAESKPTIVKKPSIFDRLRKVSLGCIPTLASVSSPLTPVARSSARFPHDPRATLGTLSTKGLSIYTPSLASEMSGWDYMFLSPVTSEGSQSLTIRASLALFPEDVTNRPDLSPVIEQSEEWDVIRNDDGVVTKATLRGLIRLFTDPHEMLKNDMADVIDAFFLFSPIFTTPQNLLELLLAHENDAPPDGLDKFRWKMNHNLTRAYAANLICVWLESHWDNDLEKRVQDDLFKRIGIHTARLSADLNVPIEIPHQLVDSIRRRGSWAEAEKARTEEAVMGDNYFETLFRDNLEQVVSSLTRPSDWSALDITYFHDDGGPELLARQLTIVEAEFFHSFEPRELIKFEDFEIQRKLQAWRAFTEGISLWVQKSVVSHNDVTLRAKAITVFIAAAAVCKSLRNYNSALALLLGVTASPVSRLKRTEDSILRCFKDMRGELDTFFHGRKNFAEYRAELPINLPTVPLQVIVCKDVKICREVLPRVKSTVQPSILPAEEMIPLQYYRNLRRTIRDLEKCRGEYKALKKVDVIYDWLKFNAGQFKVKGYEAYRNEFMDISHKIEPKTDSRGPETPRL